MEKYNHQEYRDNLAKKLKGVEDHEERREVLEKEKKHQIIARQKKKSLVKLQNTKITLNKLIGYRMLLKRCFLL